MVDRAGLNVQSAHVSDLIFRNHLQFGLQALELSGGLIAALALDEQSAHVGVSGLVGQAELHSVSSQLLIETALAVASDLHLVLEAGLEVGGDVHGVCHNRAA